MGSDGAATLGSFEHYTARQPTPKLSVIDDSLIFGMSGPVGLGQRLHGCIEMLWKERQKTWPLQLPLLLDLFRSNLWRFIEPEYRAAAVAQQCLGPAASTSARCQSILALPIQDQPFLIQFDHQASPEYATEELPFIAIGGGQEIADPFLAFLREIFWQERRPSLADGIFAACWTLEHAIRVNPGGVGPPLQLAVLERKEGKWTARLIDEVEMEEHKQAIGRAEDHLRAFPLSPDAAKEFEKKVPPPPEPKD